MLIRSASTRTFHDALSALLRVVLQSAPPSALDRVRQRARKDTKAKFTTLLHHVTVDRLRAAYYEMKKKAAAGVDGVTWEQYGEQLEENIQRLHAQVHRGAYRAKPSRRVYIPKADGRQRPLGIASLEDKLVQRVVVEVLNAIYEVDFLGFSYGFREGRGQHDALDALATAIIRRTVNWVLDADIRGFFDAIDHGWLMKFIEHRIADRRVLRLIQKWLSAGVMEEGRWQASEKGSPQGATVSPLLANLFLHYAFDLWVQWWRQKQAGGDVVAVRYADDVVLGFEHEDGGSSGSWQSYREVASGSAWSCIPEKTRLLEFGRHATARGGRGADSTGRQRRFQVPRISSSLCDNHGRAVSLARHTDPKRMRATLQAIKQELVRTPAHPHAKNRASGSGGSCGGLPSHITPYRPTYPRIGCGSRTEVDAYVDPSSSGSGATTSDDLGKGQPALQTVASRPRESASLARRSDLTPEPKARAQCGNAARWDPSGGRPETERQGPSLPRRIWPISA